MQQIKFSANQNTQKKKKNGQHLDDKMLRKRQPKTVSDIFNKASGFEVKAFKDEEIPDDLNRAIHDPEVVFPMNPPFQFFLMDNEKEMTLKIPDTTTGLASIDVDKLTFDEASKSMLSFEQEASLYLDMMFAGGNLTAFENAHKRGGIRAILSRYRSSSSQPALISSS